MGKQITCLSKPIAISDHKEYKEATFLISVLDEWDLNGRLIPKEAGEKYHKTIIGFPVVAKLITDPFGKPIDFKGHEFKMVKGKDGKKQAKFGTVPIGSVLDSWIEKREVKGYDGEKDCILIKTKLWSSRFPQYFEVLDKLWEEDNVDSSWELVIEESEQTPQGIIIKAFSFIGNALLGRNVAGAVPSAGVYEYASKENVEFSDCINLANALSLDTIQSSNIDETVVKEEKMAKSKLDQVKVDSKDTELVDEKDKVVDEVATDETKPEVTDGETDKVDEVDEVSEKDKDKDKDGCKAEEEDEKPEDEKDDKKDDVETSEMTTSDLYKALDKAIGEKTDWFGYMSYVFVDKGYCLVHSYEQNEMEFVKFDYTINEDNSVTVGEPENVVLKVSIADINDVVAEKDDALAKANEKIVSLESEVATLSEYKEKIAEIEEANKVAELEQKRESLKKYALDSKRISDEEIENDENIKNMISEVDENGIKALISDRLVASLEVSNVQTSEKNVSVSQKAKADLSCECENISVTKIMDLYLGK